ncbi:uncharacterized protein [Ptychodera flava]|uniref:uncharacterized protein isoform X2 n=1 Tax=Ptychodera flava TaxID=63121 RepID=UPI00396A18C9
MASYIDYERKCSAVNGITQSDVSEAIRHLEYWKRPLLRHERECLEFCRRLLVRFSREVLKNASIVVQLTLFKVVLTAGDGFSIFEISLDRFGIPKYRQVFDWKRNIPRKYNEVYGLAKRTTNKAGSESKTYRFTYPRYNSIDDVKLSLDNIVAARPFIKECYPFITFKNIHEVIAHFQKSANGLDSIDASCLRHCLTVVGKCDNETLRNAHISVFGKHIRAVIVSGTQKRQIEISLDENYTPICQDVSLDDDHKESETLVDDALSDRSVNHGDFLSTERPYVKHCHPFISAKNISDVIGYFEESAEGLDPVDRICLRHCYTVMEQNDSKTLSSALLSVFGKSIKAVFTAGGERNKFEVTLDENYTPICRKIHIPNELQDDTMDSNHEEIVVECSPTVNFRHIRDVILKLEASTAKVPESDMRCLMYCYAIVEQHADAVLDNAIITVLGRCVTVIFKSGMQVNQFEITLNSHGNPICHHTKKQSQRTKQNERAKDQEEPTCRPFLNFGNIVEDCYPCISFKHIHDVIMRLESSQKKVNDGDMRCLKYCFTLVKEKGEQVLENVHITVYGIGGTIIFKCGSEKNVFQITLNDQYEPICRETRKTGHGQKSMAVRMHDNEDSITERRPFIKQCHPFISAKNVCDVIERFEESAEGLDPVDRICLKHCFTVVDKYDTETLNSALISVFGKFLKVVFTAGGERNKFEVTLDENYTPIFRKTSVQSRQPEDDKELKQSSHLGEIVEDCRPSISFEHINGVIMRLKSSANQVQDGDIRCLKYCYTLVKQQEKGILENAKITVYGVSVTVVLKCGFEVNVFEVTLNDRNEPICQETRKTVGEIPGPAKKGRFLNWDDNGDLLTARRPHINQCHPFISAKHISNVITHFEESPEGLDPVDRICLRHCFKVVENNDTKILSSALLSVFGKIVKVVFTSGGEKHKFEIRLDENYRPIYKKTSSESDWVSNEESVHEASSVQKEEMQWFKFQCQPSITFKQINNAISEISRKSHLRLNDESLLRYCVSLLRERDMTVWQNAIISVYGTSITVVFKSGDESNEFEITLDDREKPSHIETTDTKRRHRSLGYESMDLEDPVDSPRVFTSEETYGKITTFEKRCRPSISFDEIHEVIGQLKATVTDNDMRCLKFCYEVVKSYPSEDLKDASLVVYGENIKVVFSSGSENNRFGVTMNDENDPVLHDNRSDHVKRDHVESMFEQGTAASSFESGSNFKRAKSLKENLQKKRKSIGGKAVKSVNETRGKKAKRMGSFQEDQYFEHYGETDATCCESENDESEEETSVASNRRRSMLNENGDTKVAILNEVGFVGSNFKRAKSLKENVQKKRKSIGAKVPEPLQEDLEKKGGQIAKSVKENRGKKESSPEDQDCEHERETDATSCDSENGESEEETSVSSENGDNAVTIPNEGSNFKTEKSLKENAQKKKKSLVEKIPEPLQENLEKKAPFQEDQDSEPDGGSDATSCESEMEDSEEETSGPPENGNMAIVKRNKGALFKN